MSQGYALAIEGTSSSLRHQPCKTEATTGIDEHNISLRRTMSETWQVDWALSQATW